MTVRDRMCYLTLSEYAENDVRPLASLSLFLFSADLEALNFRLSQLPQPFSLASDLKVSLLVQADFYVPQGRFQAKVLDIDPVYTLGELALTRQAILKRLDAEGLRDRNRRIAMPKVPLRIGLVTAPGSAAYHDFTTTLTESGYAFEVVAAYARMQGNETESTILIAMGQLLQRRDLDVICIVRGGGGKADLNYFDSEALCRAVALCPVPVLTGIGHEIDQSLVDLVSWKACITPTDSAKFLVRYIEEAWSEVIGLVEGVVKSTRLRIEREQGRFRGMLQGLSRRLPGRFARERERQVRAIKDIQRGLRQRLETEGRVLERNRLGLKQGSHKLLEMSRLRFELIQEKVKAADPMLVVRRGYSITTGRNGKLVRSPEDAEVGTELVTRFAWGSLRSQVTSADRDKE